VSADAYAAFPSLELDRPAAGVLRLTLRAPGKLNAVDAAMHGELAAVWKTIADD
jgi:enoyl-CoA hydratase